MYFLFSAFPVYGLYADQAGRTLCKFFFFRCLLSSSNNSAAAPRKPMVPPSSASCLTAVARPPPRPLLPTSLSSTPAPLLPPPTHRLATPFASFTPPTPRSASLSLGATPSAPPRSLPLSRVFPASSAIPTNPKFRYSSIRSRLPHPQMTFSPPQPFFRTRLSHSLPL